MKLDTQRVFDRILIIMFENQYRGYVMANTYMKWLAEQGLQLRNYFGVMHPSQTNYISSVAGELCNVTSDARPHPLLDQRTIVDLVEEAPGGLRWKAYMESYVASATPWSPSFTPEDAKPYYVKHNPFASFSSIVRSDARWRCIENEAAFFADVLNGELPEYAWVTPNIWSDGHWMDGTEVDPVPRAPLLVDQLARWLEGFFGRLRFPGPQSHLPPRTLVVVTFDESDFEMAYETGDASTYDGPNQIYTVLLGDTIVPGIEEEGYNHYSLLRTVEKNFGLGNLKKNDAQSNWFHFLWGRRFEWGVPIDTPFSVEGPLSTSVFNGDLFVACGTHDGKVRIRRTNGAGSAWSPEETLPLDGSGGVGMAATATELLLLARSPAGNLQCIRFDGTKGWLKENSPAAGAVTSFAIASFAQDARIMLVFSDSTGGVVSRLRDGSGITGGWRSPVSIPAARAMGDFVLGSQGESLFLMARTLDTGELRVVSFNLAPFNVVSVPTNPYGGPQDNTTVEAWSPCSFPVAHFSSRPDKTGEIEPLMQPYAASGPMAAATLDGVMHLLHSGNSNPALLSTTFSISGVMTPSQPVSYKSRDVATASNGFGTMAEAGWSRQLPVADLQCEPDGAIAMCRFCEELISLVRVRPGVPVKVVRGRYLEARPMFNDSIDSGHSAGPS